MLLHSLVCDMENGQNSALKKKENMNLYENILRINVIEVWMWKRETEKKNEKTNCAESAMV